MKMNRVAILANMQKSGEVGGAEIFHQKLYESMSRLVPEVELIQIPCSERTFEDILCGYLDCYDLDLSSFDGVISSKAPTFAARHPNHVCYLMHTVRVFYDMFEELSADPVNHQRRELLLHMDKEIFQAPHIKKMFSIGQEVSDRLVQHIGVESQPLHPGITSEGFYTGEYRDYLYMPGRLHHWKRPDLAIKAMKYVRAPLELRIAGKGAMEDELRALAGDDPRIHFLGFVSDEEMRYQYANALGVVFVPVREDYGYITHEAFKSKKPVITCRDSGEPVHFVEHGVSGYISEPDPKILAAWIDQLYESRMDAPHMGEAGKKSIEHITWERVAETLLKALEE